MEAGINFDILKLVQEFKMHDIVAVIILVVLIYSLIYIGRKLIDYLFDKFGSKKKDGKSSEETPRNPGNNPSLTIWDGMIRFEVDQMHLDCIFRDKIFKMMLKIRFQTMLNELKKALENEDFNKMSEEEMLNFWNTFMVNTRVEWTKGFRAEGIPEVVMFKFESALSSIYNHMLSEIAHACRQQGVYLNNNGRAIAITDILQGASHNTMWEVSNLHQALNGDFEGLACQGVSCPCKGYESAHECKIHLVKEKKEKKEKNA